VPDEQNLIIRAARLLQSQAASPQGAHIRLEKVLPMGGGIGRLVGRRHHPRGLNHLWQAGLSEDELAELGVQLGADVPVFVRGRPPLPKAWGSGCNRSRCRCLVSGAQARLPCGHRRRVPGSRPARDTPKMTLDNLLEGEWKNDCELLVKSATPRLPMRSAGC
jgi:4-diphosphocytidyl-2-C-methyl-D-erythritol kinase